MKKITSKQIIPIITCFIGIVFAYVGVFQLGFWEKKPLPGFFPTIVATVIIVASIAALFQSFSDDNKPKFNKDELSVILGGLSIIIGTFIIGLIPSVILYMLYWLKIIEKAPWKDTLIIMAIILFIVFGVFVSWLQVSFPMGIFERFM
ncbi:MAG: tripartite tricarboxylate transporter TctB family protein [Alphaproteobacteria bacterium]